MKYNRATFPRQNVPDPVWAYDQRINDFRIFSTQQEWKDHITVSGAICYLKEHLQESLINDFYPAYKAYIQESDKRKVGIGFFALPRIVFPYITFLGTLLGGRDLSQNAIDYMNRYLSRDNQTFSDKQLCDFIYRVYRHGLAHTNMPKVVSGNGLVFGWGITYDDSQHLTVDRTPGINGKSALLIISPNRLAGEVISSIDEYIKDMHAGAASFDNFKNGFISMAKTLHYIDWQKTKRIIIPDYLK